MSGFRLRVGGRWRSFAFNGGSTRQVFPPVWMERPPAMRILHLIPDHLGTYFLVATVKEAVLPRVEPSAAKIGVV